MQPYEEQTISRKEFTADIIQQVQNEVQNTLLHSAPLEWKDEELEQIEEQVLDHTRIVLDALSIGELQSRGALDRHIEQANAETMRLIHDRSARRSS
jgi:hypothetical protein